MLGCRMERGCRVSSWGCSVEGLVTPWGGGLPQSMDMQGHVGQRLVQEGPPVPGPPAPVSGGAQPGAGSALAAQLPWSRPLAGGSPGVLRGGWLSKTRVSPLGSGRELSAAGGARKSSAAPGQRSRPSAALPAPCCPRPGLRFAGLFALGSPPRVSCPPQPHCRPLFFPLPGRGGAASSGSLWQLSPPPALVLAGFPCRR